MNSTVVVAGLGLVAIFVVYRYLLQCPARTGRALEIGGEIHDQAMLFLGRTYALLAMTAVVAALVLLAGFQAWRLPVGFVVGVLCSACAGYIGLYVTSRADFRVAEAARTEGASAAYSRMLHGGSIAGLVVAATGLLGLGSIYLLQGVGPSRTGAVPGFGLGVFATALWSRVGGAMTAGSIGAGLALAREDETGTGADEVRNRGLVAGTAAHNVADTAGVGSDLLGSWCGSIIAAITIASTLSAPVTALIGPQHQLMVLPLMLASSGFVCSIVGITVVWLTSDRLPGPVSRVGAVGAALLFVGVAFFVVQALDSALLVWLCVLGGALGGQAIALFLEYSVPGSPARYSAGADEAGKVVALDRGLLMALAWVVIPVAVLVVVLVAALVLMPDGAGAYGMSIAAVGMLSTVGMTLATHSCGPVAGNAARIAAMAEPGPEANETARLLDQHAGACAAAARAFAVVAGGLAAFVMVAAIIRLMSHRSTDLSLHAGEPVVLLGLCLGVALPFALSAITLRSLGRSGIEFGRDMRQRFQKSHERVQGAGEPESDHPVDRGTASMIRQIAVPGSLALLVPVVVGFGLGARGLGGLLVGVLAGGLLLVLLMPVAAVAWRRAGRNRDKTDGENKGFGGRMAAAVVRGAVGNPLEDVVAPSVTVLVNVLAIVSLAIAPILSR